MSVPLFSLPVALIVSTEDYLSSWLFVHMRQLIISKIKVTFAATCETYNSSLLCVVA